MDTGKILIGFAFIILAAALVVSPSQAEMQGPYCEAGSGFVCNHGQPAAMSFIHYEPTESADPGYDPISPANPVHLP
ncbi:MAG: hypothetical protein WC586_01305 [Methanoregula sp.]